MTMASPLGPTFFCAPAYTMPKRDTSSGRERMSLDISATSSAEPGLGQWWNWVPRMVLLLVMCR